MKSTVSEETLARVVLRAATIREESYDKDESALAQAKALGEKRTDPDNPYAGVVDYNRFYGLSIEEACEKAAKECGHPKLQTPVYLMLGSWWNDAMDWAEETLGIHPPVVSGERDSGL